MLGRRGVGACLNREFEQAEPVGFRHCAPMEIEMAKFKRGDTVILKSGGPMMTVEHCEYEDEIKCTWFDDKHKRQSEAFHEDLLEDASASPL